MVVEHIHSVHGSKCYIIIIEMMCFDMKLPIIEKKPVVLWSIFIIKKKVLKSAKDDFVNKSARATADSVNKSVHSTADRVNKIARCFQLLTRSV
jgi:hypothetical protein